MTPELRRAFISPEVTLALDPAEVRALVGLVAPGFGIPVEPLALARLFWDGLVPEALADALHGVVRLGTRAGSDGIVEGARDAAIVVERAYETPPLDLAARLVAAGARDAPVRERAHIRVARLLPERATYERRAALPRRAGPLTGIGPALSAVAGGPWSDVWVHEDEAGVVHAVLLYAAPAEAVCSVDAAGPVRVVRHALRADVFACMVADGRLAMTSAHPTRIDAYAAAWGAALYDDPAFFGDAPSITLKPFLALGAKGMDLATLPPGIKRVTVIGCALDSGMGDRIEARGPRALQQVSERRHRGGYLTRATIRFELAPEGASAPGAKSPEQEVSVIDAVLELPYKISIGAPVGSPGAAIVRAALTRIGLLSPGQIGDDVTTLMPLVMPEWRLRAILGDRGFEAMKRAGLLELVPGEKTRRAATAAMRRAGWSAVAFPLRHAGSREHAREHEKPTHYYMVSPDPAIWATTLPAADLAMFRVRIARVVAKARKELGLTRVRKPALPKGVLWLGEMRLPSGVASFFYVVRAAVGDRDAAALGRAITRAAGFGRAVAMVPAGRKLGRDFVEVELSVRQQLGAESWRPKLEEAARALGVLDEIPVERLAPEGVDIVVDTKQERVIYRGTWLSRLADSGYRLVKALAQRGEPVPTSVTDAAISGARQTEGATRMTVHRMKAWIEESYADARKPLPPELAANGLVRAVGRKGWELVGRAYVR